LQFSADLPGRAKANNNRPFISSLGTAFARFGGVIAVASNRKAADF